MSKGSKVKVLILTLWVLGLAAFTYLSQSGNINSRWLIMTGISVVLLVLLSLSLYQRDKMRDKQRDNNEPTE